MKHFISVDALKVTESLQGAFLGIVQTENLTIAYTKMMSGAEIPLHHHVEEAVDIVLEGEVEMQIGEITDTLKPGMFSIVPSNVPHKARAITQSQVMTIFNPKRRMD